MPREGRIVIAKLADGSLEAIRMLPERKPVRWSASQTEVDAAVARLIERERMEERNVAR